MPRPADDIVDLYQRHARAWDDARGRSLFERPWLDRFLALVPPAGSVLDIGCGGGEPITRYLLEQGRSVTGIDSSAPLIALCRERFPAAVFEAADMRRMTLNRQFDGLIAWDSFFHLTAGDQRSMFPRFAEHAAPGAALLFTSGPSSGEAIGEFEGDPLYHASLDPSEYRALLKQSGFAVVDMIAEDRSCGGHTVWLARRV